MVSQIIRPLPQNICVDCAGCDIMHPEELVIQSRYHLDNFMVRHFLSPLPAVGLCRSPGYQANFAVWIHPVVSLPIWCFVHVCDCVTVGSRKDCSWLVDLRGLDTSDSKRIIYRASIVSHFPVSPFLRYIQENVRKLITSSAHGI